MIGKPLGFGTIRQTAEFFGLTQSEVRRTDWPSYVILGKRVWDLDAIVEGLAKAWVRQLVLTGNLYVTFHAVGGRETSPRMEVT